MAIELPNEWGNVKSMIRQKALDKTGDTMTGDLSLYRNPTADSMAANKGYVDYASRSPRLINLGSVHSICDKVGYSEDSELIGTISDFSHEKYPGIIIYVFNYSATEVDAQNTAYGAPPSIIYRSVALDSDSSRWSHTYNSSALDQECPIFRWEYYNLGNRSGTMYLSVSSNGQVYVKISGARVSTASNYYVVLHLLPYAMEDLNNATT